MGQARIIDKITGKVIEYYMDDRLKRNLDELVIKSLKKKDKDFVMCIDGKEGCISEDTIIRTNRAYIGRKYTIKWIYNQFHGNPDKLKITNKWNLNIPTFIRAFDGNRIRLHQIKNVLYSGKKEIYNLTLENGKSIKTTAEHKIMTNEGFVELLKLDKNKHKIMCDSPKTRANKNFKHKFHDIQIGGLIYYPSKRKRIEIHRIIYESHLNNLDLSKFIEILSTNEELSKGLKFINQNMTIHHKDFNHYNNNINNLDCISIDEHLKIHSIYNYKNFNQGIPEFYGIESINYVGFEDTYDIQCVIPYHNFSANDIIISNSGKTTIAIQIGKYVDPSLNLSRIVFNANEFREAIFRANKGECIIFDEAFTGLSSRAVLSGINKTLVSLMMQMRQKNLFVIIVLPTFFLLDKYVALFRARTLLHIYENSGNRGYFRVYPYKLKKLLYLFGKKDYSYGFKIARTRFKGRFYGKFALGDEKVEKEYRKKKQEALEQTEKDPMTIRQIKYRNQRDICIYIIRKISKMSYRQLENYLQDYDLDLSFTAIGKICAAFGDKEGKLGKELIVKDDLEEENKEKINEIDENIDINEEKDDFIDKKSKLNKELIVKD